MRQNIVLLGLCLIGYIPILKGEDLPPILIKLASVNKAVQVFSPGSAPLIDLLDLPVNFRNTGWGIVKTEKDLFVLPNGTGRVYRLDKQNKGYRWVREDSTFYTGYNFGAFNFTWNNKIYSFGGHGFWNTNGNLRFFNETGREWHVVQLNKTIHWENRANISSPRFVYLDTGRANLIIQRDNVTSDQSLKNTSDTVSDRALYSLDLKNGDWRFFALNRDTQYVPFAMTPWGLLVDMVSLVDLHTNRYLTFNQRLKEEMTGKFAHATYKKEWLVTFFVDSVFYFGSFKNPYDSIVITRKDLVDTGIEIYTIPNAFDNIAFDSFSFSAGAVLVILAGFVLRTTRKNLKKFVESTLTENAVQHIPANSINAVANNPDLTPPAEKTIAFRSSRLLDLLEEKERSLLEFIYRYSAEERLTTIDEINKVIGVGSRSAEIQKRMRSDLIGSINQKMGLITKDKKPLIEKQRSEFDKRSFEYFIRTEHMELVERVLGRK